MKRFAEKLIGVIIGLALVAGGALFVVTKIFNLEIPFTVDFWSVLACLIILLGILCIFKRGSRLFGLWAALIGVFVLNDQQGWVEIGLSFWPAVGSITVVIIGLAIIGGIFGIGKSTRAFVHLGGVSTTKAEPGSAGVNAVFSSHGANFDGVEFTGAEVTAVFGSAVLDLRGAVINQDCRIEVSTVFGGVEIFVPANVKLVVNSTPVFGGVDNQAPQVTDAPFTISIDASAVFGGVEIK